MSVFVVPVAARPDIVGPSCRTITPVPVLKLPKAVTSPLDGSVRDESVAEFRTMVCPPSTMSSVLFSASNPIRLAFMLPVQFPMGPCGPGRPFVPFTPGIPCAPVAPVPPESGRVT